MLSIDSRLSLAFRRRQGPWRAVVTALALVAVLVPGLSAQTARRAVLIASSSRAPSVVAGQTFTDTIQVSCVTGPTTVALSADVAPPGPTVSLSPTRVTTPASATLTFATTAATPSGRYAVTITAQVLSGSCLSSSATFAIDVRRPVALAVSPAQVSAPPGGSAVYNVAIGRSGFTGAVELRTDGLPAGFNATFNPNNTNGNASTLTVAVPDPTGQCGPPNGCAFKVRGRTSSGVQVDAADARLIVQRSVAFTADPPVTFAKTGDRVTVEIGIVRAGYAGEVGISIAGTAAPGTVVKVDPMVPTLGDVFTVTVEIPANGPGIYQLTATPQVPAGVTSTPVDFEIRVSLAFSVTIRATPLVQAVAQGLPAFLDLEITKVNVSGVTFLGVLGLPSGTVAVADRQVDPTRVTIFTSTLTDPGTYVLSVQGQFVDPNGLQPFVLSNPVTLTVLGIGDAPGVDLSAEDVVKDVPAGGSASFRVTAARRGGFTGRVDLSASPTPAPGGAAVSFSPASLASGVNESTLTVSAPAGTPAGGPFTLTVGATTVPAVAVTPATVRYRIVAANAPRVTLTANPASLTIPSGQTATSTITATRVNCSGAITLTRPATLPPEIADLTFRSLTADSFEARVAAAGVSAQRTVWLTIGAQAPGCANVQVQPATLTVTVQPAAGGSATLSLQPPVVNLTPGQSATTSVQIARSGSVGAITLAASGLPAGVAASFSPNPAAGASAVLTLQATSGAAAQTTSFQVTGTAAGSAVTPAAGTVVVSGLAPTITSFTPSSGTAGTNVQIFGTDLTNVQNVLFNGVGAAYAPISPTQVNATVPGFATTGPIAVVTAAGTAVSPSPFIVGASSQTPQITGFSPASGPAGTSVRINGVNLGGVFDVSIGTPAQGFAPVGFTPGSSTFVDALILGDSRSGFFRVTTPNGTATSATAFQVTTPNLPEIGGFNPISGAPGTRVEIVGTNLGGATQVTFGGAVASFDPPQPNRIVATVPPLAATGPIRVTTPAGTATSFTSFAVTSGGPVITDFQPRSGQVGFSVTIAGAKLLGTSEVTFNGVRAEIGIVLDNFVQVFVPAGATTGPIRLVTPAGTATSPFPFTVQ